MTRGYPARIPARFALTATTRSAAMDILRQADISLQPAAKRELGSIVTRLLSSYPADGASEATARARAENWMIALDGLPAWAVDAAHRKWMRGEVPGVNPDFEPKPPRFRQVATALLGPVLERRNQLSMLLKAEVEPEISTEERSRVSSRLDELSRELRQTQAAADMRSAAKPDHEHHDSKAA